jgi:nicotinamidase-related amidase
MLGSVPQQVLPADEVPSAVSAFVPVAILDRLVDPAIAVLDLALAVDHAPGLVVVVVEVDHVVADEEDRDADPPELAVEAGSKSLSTRSVPTDADVVYEEADQRVEISRVERQRVARGQLPDGIAGDEALEVVHRRAGWRTGASGATVSPRLQEEPPLPIDLESLAAPGHTALVVQECQRGVIGDRSGLPALAEAAAGDLVPNIARLAEAARQVGMPVIHCTAVRRSDGLGANHNARLFHHMARAEEMLLPGSEAAEIVPGIEVAESDLVLPRLHGLSPFHGTELDFVLRNQGVTTLVGVGVSVNVAITNLTFDAVNASYQVIIPRDAVAGFPSDYVEAVFENTLGAIATITTTAELLATWKK